MRHLVFLLLALLACGGKTGNYKADYAGPIAIELVNQTSRPIEEVFIFPSGSANRGTSWTSLKPGETTTVKIKEGHFELVAVSARRRIDAHSSEKPEATSQLELREDLKQTPRKLVFHDDGDHAGVDAPGTLGVTFTLSNPIEDKPAEPQTP